MSAPDLETQGNIQTDRPPLPAPEAGTASRAKVASTASAVIWNESIAPAEVHARVLSRLGFVVERVIGAGGGSLADDRKSLAGLADAKGPIVILTPAWEPPQLEFVDFLTEVRKVVGVARAIVVVPVAESEQSVTHIEHENWSRAVGRARDPNAFVDKAEA